MSTFPSSDELYQVLGGFLTEVTQSPDLGPKFAGAGVALVVRYSDPDAVILLDCRVDPPQLVNDPSAVPPSSVQIEMSADNGHKFWLGDNVPMGLAKRQVRISGPIGTVMKLLPAMQPAFTRYREYLDRHGYEHTLR